MTIGNMIEGEKLELSFGRSGKRGLPKLRIKTQSRVNETDMNIIDVHITREDAERLHREIGLVLEESK